VEHYEVSEEVAAQFDETFVARKGEARPHVDLWKANTAQLRQAGVQRVEFSGYCTVGRPDLFFSHRGSGGKTGRMIGMIGIAG
jgi:hypothetical protein